MPTNYLASGTVQQISITIASGQLQGTQSINATGAGAFILFLGVNPSELGTQCDDTMARIELTNNTTVTAIRGALGVGTTINVKAVVIDGDVVNFIKSIQHGTITFGTSDFTKTTSINSVTNSNTAIAYLGSSSATSSTQLSGNEIILDLTGTTVSGMRQSSGTAEIV